MEGGPGRDQRRRRLLPRRPGPPAADAARAGRRHRPQARSTSSSTTAAATCSRRSSATRSTSPPPVPASSRTRSPTATSGCWPPAATSGSTGIDAPTLKEAGIDLVFTNWRGIVAPPGISDAQKERLVDAFQKMHETQEWKDALKANSWADAFQTSDQFGDVPHRAGQAGRGHAERAGAGMSQAVSPAAPDVLAAPLRAGGRPPARGGRRGRPRRRAPAGRPHHRLGPGRPAGLPARRRRAAPGLRRGAGRRRAARRPRRGRGGRGRRPRRRRPSGGSCCPLLGGLRRQRAADRRARLGDLRRDAVLRLRLVARQPPPTSATR